MLALPLAGCGRGDTGSATKNAVEQQIETRSEENEGCPDGTCPDNGGCNGDECPVKPLEPHGRHRRGRVKPLPYPDKGN